MTSLKTHDLCDLDVSFDAVPDKPRDIIDNVKAAKEEILQFADEAEARKSNLETTIHNDTAPVNTSVIAPPPPKKSERRKPGPKTIPLHQQGTTTYNITKSTGVHIGHTMVMQYNGPVNPIVKPRKKTKEIETLLANSEAIMLEHIDVVSRNVGTKWMSVGRRLQYKDAQLEQIEEDNRGKGLKEVVYQLLLDWKRVNTSQATVGLLCTALWKEQQYDAVDVVLLITNKTKTC